SHLSTPYLHDALPILRDRPWAQAAAEAGLTFVSPEWPVAQVFGYFARAQLVVTEAMHGAIIADALRIPWVPVKISPELDEFKWRSEEHTSELQSHLKL